MHINVHVQINYVLLQGVLKLRACRVHARLHCQSAAMFCLWGRCSQVYWLIDLGSRAVICLGRWVIIMFCCRSKSLTSIRSMATNVMGVIMAIYYTSWTLIYFMYAIYFIVVWWWPTIVLLYYYLCYWFAVNWFYIPHLPPVMKVFFTGK